MGGAGLRRTCHTVPCMTSLFDPARFGDIALANRVVMAPLTRNRAHDGHRPNDLMRLYYEQRATAGLIVTEGTPISAEAHGYLDTPGLHDEAVVAGWRRITDAVHAAGGRIVVQLWHVGRISHASLLPAGVQPVSSSAIPAQSKTYIAGGFAPVAAPRALRGDELPRIVEDFRRAAQRAMDAGFDGVEVHGANGYLLDQFLRDSLNHRDDGYGGPIERRVRLVVEVMQAIAHAIGAGRTGLRISPVTPSNDAAPDSQPQQLHEHLMQRLAPLRLAFIHVIEGATGGARDHLPFDYDALRRIYKQAHPGGGWIVNNGYTRAMALEAVAQGGADAVAFGRPFIANPDLVERLRRDAPLNALDRSTLYGGDGKGYVDYPSLV